MLSAQLVGRLLPEIQHSDNIRSLQKKKIKHSDNIRSLQNKSNYNFPRNLLRQCDTEGIKQNALVTKKTSGFLI